MTKARVIEVSESLIQHTPELCIDSPYMNFFIFDLAKPASAFARIRNRLDYGFQTEFFKYFQ
jgi:hypothetical protein